MYGRVMAVTAGLLMCTLEAQAAPAASASVLDAFARCRTIPAAEARADCFDTAARGLEAAVAAKEVTIVNRQEIRTARRSLFGFVLPRIALFEGGDRDDKDEPAEFTEIETTIAAVRPVANGRVELRMAEGDALWVTTDVMPFPPKPGAPVRIRKGAMGNYFIAVKGQRSVRGMRLR